MPDNFDTKQANKSRRKYVKREQPADLVDRKPPFNLEAEVGVLGSVMLMPDTCDEIVNLLRPDDFYDECASNSVSPHDGNAWRRQKDRPAADPGDA